MPQEHLTRSLLEQLTLRWEAWEKEATTTAKKIVRARLHLLFLLIRYGGLRLGEALSLNVRQDVDTVTGMVHVPDPGGRDVLLPVSCMKHIRRILSLPEAESESFLHFDQGFVRRKFYAVAEGMGLAPGMAGPRAIRYARGLELLELHVPFNVVQAYLGQQKTAQIAEFLDFAGGEAKRIVKNSSAGRPTTDEETDNAFIGIITDIRTGMRAASVEVTTFSDLVITARCDVRQFLNMELHLNQVATVSIDPEQIVLSAEKASLALQGPVRATVTALHQDTVESFLVLELADGTRMNAVQETAHLARLRVRQGSRVYLSFPARAVSLSTD
ncbi:TOBE domain-containing protein [uncultured Mailhella sp.]|uniref:TOBE domain-containing protein n=1 Tax=uncultured Mailhella sp. TaxID=1981031 RepID=UPI0025E02B66|nr:TOBE domain-containing protein [uncultured Mailhella sp.]